MRGYESQRGRENSGTSSISKRINGVFNSEIIRSTEGAFLQLCRQPLVSFANPHFLQLSCDDLQRELFARHQHAQLARHRLLITKQLCRLTLRGLSPRLGTALLRWLTHYSRTHSNFNKNFRIIKRNHRASHQLPPYTAASAISQEVRCADRTSIYTAYGQAGDA